jgi:hypothetical protein
LGERRRRCSLCKKTWRVWQKKRGRKHDRLDMNYLFKYFKGIQINARLKKKTHSARLRSLLNMFNQNTPCPPIPDGPLIVIADGLIQFFSKEKYTIYFILIRSTTDSKAFILPPYMRKGGEVNQGWREAFAQIPNEIFVRIKALVCDGHGGLIYLAKGNNWVLQRCQFHLLARVAHCASFGLLGKSNGVGIRVKNLIEVALYTHNSNTVSLAIGALIKIKLGITSKTFKGVISGFIKNYDDYRSYLNYPQYNLPATSNTAESLNALLRDLQYRARGFRTPRSLMSWIIGFCKYKKYLTCNPKTTPN